MAAVVVVPVATDVGVVDVIAFFGFAFRALADFLRGGLEVDAEVPSMLNDVPMPPLLSRECGLWVDPPPVARFFPDGSQFSRDRRKCLKSWRISKS